MKKYKFLLSVILVVILSLSIFVVPASAAYLDLNGTQYFDLYDFNTQQGTIFLTNNTSIQESFKWGVEWPTNVKPGLLVYMSGGFSNAAEFSNNDVMITLPSLDLYNPDSGHDMGMYINKGEVIQVSGDFAWVSENRAEIDYIRFAFVCLDESTMEVIRFNVDVELSEYNFYNEAYFDLSAIYNPSVNRDLHVMQILLQVHIPDFGPAYTTGSGQIGFGVFDPGFGVFLGNKDEVPKYKSPNRNSVDKEQELMSTIDSATSDGRNEAVTIMQRLESVVSLVSPIGRGLMAVTNMLNVWLRIDWIDNIVVFALALGIFSFLIGSGFLITRALRGSSSSERRR